MIENKREKPMPVAAKLIFSAFSGHKRTVKNE